MAELLTTTQGSTTTVHPWYQLFKTRLTHIALDEITMVPNVEITIDEEEKKHFEKNGMLTPIVIDENNLLIDGTGDTSDVIGGGSQVAIHWQDYCDYGCGTGLSANNG